MRRVNFLCLAFLLLVGLCSEAYCQLDKQRFDELMELVVPATKTQQIDWLPDLVSAQQASLNQKKPIFIWSMDGHPLGCT